MKPDVIKSKTDPRKFIGLSVLAAFLLITNLVGWNRFIYRDLDFVFNPFVIATRNTGQTMSLFLKEVTNKAFVIQENIELKRKIVEYDETKVQNQELIDQINRLSSQTNISVETEKKLELVRISGAQNLFSSDPVLRLAIPGDEDVAAGQPVYYEKNTLFGFVDRVEGQTAFIIPYYSPRIKFNIPVQNFSDSNQRGFIQKIDKGRVLVRNVAREAAINTGDLWITTNDVAEVPSGLIVGVVKSISVSSDGGFQEVELELPFDFSETSYLFIEKK